MFSPPVRRLSIKLVSQLSLDIRNDAHAQTSSSFSNARCALKRGLFGEFYSSFSPCNKIIPNKAPRSKLRGITMLLQLAGLQPAFTPSGGELNPKRLN